MKKQITIDLPEISFFEPDFSIEELQNELAKLKEKGVTHIRARSYSDESSIYVTPSIIRDETDEEERRRKRLEYEYDVQAAKKKQVSEQMNIDAEKAILRILKIKYPDV